MYLCVCFIDIHSLILCRASFFSQNSLSSASVLALSPAPVWAHVLLLSGLRPQFLSGPLLLFLSGPCLLFLSSPRLLSGPRVQFWPSLSPS